MMRELTSKKTGKVQIIPDTYTADDGTVIDIWANIVARGWDKKYIVKELPERKLKEVPIIPAEVKTKTVKKDG